MTSVEAVRELALSLPRTTEHLISDRIKFRVGSIVYCAFSRDETTMGFGFPKVERPALVAAEPDKFFLPDEKNMRFQWVCAWVDKIEDDEMYELITEAWRMCVPKFLARERLGITN
jgi:hypothetical protein